MDFVREPSTDVRGDQPPHRISLTSTTSSLSSLSYHESADTPAPVLPFRIEIPNNNSNNTQQKCQQRQSLRRITSDVIMGIPVSASEIAVIERRKYERVRSERSLRSDPQDRRQILQKYHALRRLSSNARTLSTHSLLRQTVNLRSPYGSLLRQLELSDMLNDDDDDDDGTELHDDNSAFIIEAGRQA